MDVVNDINLMGEAWKTPSSLAKIDVTVHAELPKGKPDLPIPSVQCPQPGSGSF